MSCLCIEDLAEFTGGHLRLGDLPPLGGALEPIRRIRTQVEQLQPGDIYWQCTAACDDLQAAYARGAMGIVHQGSRIEPWAGRFSLQVRSTVHAMRQAAVRSRKHSGNCLVALLNLGNTTTEEQVCQLIHYLKEQTPLASECEPQSEIDMAREIIDLDERRPFSVFTLYRQSAEVNRRWLGRFGAEVIVTTRSATNTVFPTDAKLIYAEDYRCLARLAHAVSAAGIPSVQEEPCVALPSMSDLRESDMPTLLGRSNKLADRWLLGRSPWRVLPGRA